MATVAQMPTSTEEILELDNVRIDPAWALRVPAAFATRKRLLPLCMLNERVIVACAQPMDTITSKAVRTYLKSEFSTVKASVDSLRRALARVHDTPSMASQSNGVAELDEGGPIRNTRYAALQPSRVRMRGTGQADSEDAVAICDEFLQAAILRGASDVHLLPEEHSLAIKLRVDGHLELYRQLPGAHHSAVISRLKVLAGLDIAEKRAAQDGRITSHFGSSRRKLDIRVATLPTRYGERMTLRLLTPHDSNLSLESLGMSARELTTFNTATARPHGLVLLTGPTGSGKSTTLYVAIEQLLQSRGGNVITIEDPIEYEIEGASQVEVDAADKVNFSKALRSVLRHDPDVVMIGEIRDAETADIAVKASLTGHLVFSTLHTNTAAGVVTRLADMGVERFLIAATLRLSVAQRLVRRLCSHCRQPRPMLLTEALTLKRPQLAGQTVYDPSGCVRCAGRGYAGRVALFEMLESSEELASLMASGAGESELIEYAGQRSASTLFEDGLTKIVNGLTTVAEVVGAVATW